MAYNEDPDEVPHMSARFAGIKPIFGDRIQHFIKHLTGNP